MRRALLAFLLVAVAVIESPRLTARQSSGPDPVFQNAGFNENRDYFSQMSFEHIDTLTGNLTLTFTDFVLPGNAGMDIRFQRTYNHNGSPKWTFGLAGIPLMVRFPNGPPIVTWPPLFPRFITADGAEHEALPRTPYPEVQVPSGLDTVFLTKDFWRYSRDTGTLQLPNGYVAHYEWDPGANMGYVESVDDPFGNQITFDWERSAGRLHHIYQNLAPGEVRDIYLVYDTAGTFPHTVTFNARTWTYGGSGAMTSATPPEGPAWTFDYADGVKVTTPSGGVVHYRFENHTFSRLQPPRAGDPAQRMDIVTTVTMTGPL